MLVIPAEFLFLFFLLFFWIFPFKSYRSLSAPSIWGLFNSLEKNHPSPKRVNNTLSVLGEGQGRRLEKTLTLILPCYPHRASLLSKVLISPGLELYMLSLRLSSLFPVSFASWGHLFKTAPVLLSLLPVLHFPLSKYVLLSSSLWNLS